MKGPHTLILLLSSLLLSPFFVYPAASQPVILTQRTWGGENRDIGYGVAVDSAGNMYVTGTNATSGIGLRDIIVLKFDSTGLLLWQKTWGTSDQDESGGVAVDSSGNAYVAGYASYGAGLTDIVLLKFSSSGSLLWQKTWGGYAPDKGWGVAVDSSGSVYVTGGTASFGNFDIVLLKFDASGSLVWHRIWGGGGLEEGRGVAVDSSGNIYVTGFTETLDEDVVLLKFDSKGALVVQGSWGGSGDEAGVGIAVASSGSIYVTGASDSFGAGNFDAILLTFTTSGGLVSQKLWGGASADYGWGVTADPLGSAVITGQVDGAPLYTLSSSTAILGSPTFSAVLAGNDTLGTPAFAVATPAFTPATPSGSQSYGGGSDMFLFRYGDLLRITFQTGPSVGSITINGSSYTNGQNGNFAPGEYTATVNVPFGYTFTGWTTSGGITVANSTSNPTTVTITGPGTLRANLGSVLESPLLLVSVAVIVAGVVAGAVFFLLRRRKTAKPT